MYIQTTGIPSAFWFIDSHATNQTRLLFECLSVPFVVPFREDYHQSEDGFSTLILTNKIASGKSETGDDNTAVQCLTSSMYINSLFSNQLPNKILTEF